ncbi:MAG TPA: hypothetical protein GX697_06755 [Firmicutes bacterium]|nr:hypothetical protein [Bacillota bacterium]
MDKYQIAVIGDIIQSRSLKDRYGAQEKMSAVLNKINSLFSGHVASRFIITLGDEFQGLLLPDSPVYTILRSIIEEMYPIKIRFGVGFGEIYTRRTESAIGMDGPAFIDARKAMLEAKKGEGYRIIFHSEVMMTDEVRDINAMLTMATVIRKLWGDRFLRILPTLRKGIKQSEVARRHGLTQSNISQHIKNNYFEEVKEAEKTIDAFINDTLAGYRQV